MATFTNWMSRKTPIPRFGVALTVGVLLLSIPAASAVSEPKVSTSGSQSPLDARGVVEKTVQEVLVIMRNPSLSQQERLTSIEQIVYGKFDLTTMSRLVLARNWQRFSKEQQVEYVSLFKQYLSNNYGGRLSRYDEFEVNIKGDRSESNGHVTVRTAIVGGQFEGAELDYRLRNADGSWKVIDVKIEGISMVSNLRDQFKEVVSSGGPELLLEKLREKNAAPASAD